MLWQINLIIYDKLCMSQTNLSASIFQELNNIQNKNIKISISKIVRNY